MLKVKKQGCLLEFKWPWSFLIKENGLAIECHDQPKNLFEETTFCSFEIEKKKKKFLKIDKNNTLQRKVSTPQSFKRKIQIIFKFSLK